MKLFRNNVASLTILSITLISCGNGPKGTKPKPVDATKPADMIHPEMSGSFTVLKTRYKKEFARFPHTKFKLLTIEELNLKNFLGGYVYLEVENCELLDASIYVQYKVSGFTGYTNPIELTELNTEPSTERWYSQKKVYAFSALGNIMNLYLKAKRDENCTRNYAIKVTVIGLSSNN